MDDAYEGSYCTLRTPMQLHTPGMPMTQLHVEDRTGKFYFIFSDTFLKLFTVFNCCYINDALRTNCYGIKVFEIASLIIYVK